MTKWLNITMGLALAAACTSAAWAQAADKADAGVAEKGIVTKAQQLRIKMQLLTINDDQTMAARMNHGLEWDKLSPDQRETIRQEVLAFMSKSEAEQETLLTHYQRLIKLNNQQREAYLERAAWLRVVVESFTPAERGALESLQPEERAAKLLERKALLIREGKLPAETMPASTPTTMPAKTRIP
ncbi:MAG: hypothetical protein FWE88_04845 [Phycisphaerae bacterium]|nr:hypothetical protein [Phycisphaerae bacterium]